MNTRMGDGRMTVSENRFSRVGAFDKDLVIDATPDNGDEMCPNCVTPWKCNGPHLDDQTPRARREAKRPEDAGHEGRVLFDSQFWATEDHAQRRVVVVEADTDPGDMGEPRKVESDGVVYITVPPPEGWYDEAEMTAHFDEFEGTWWERLEPWLVEHRAEFTIYPAYPLAYGDMGPWTARVTTQRRAGRQNRYDRVFGEGPTRKAALRELVFKVLTGAP